MLDRKIVINELRKRGYIAEEKNVVKNGVLCDGISIHLPETKMENEKVQSVFGVIYMDTLEEMKEMENLSFEQVVERIIEVVWKNSPKLKRKFYWKRKREGKRNDFSRLGRRCKNDCEKFFAERNGEVKCNCCNGYYGSKHE